MMAALAILGVLALAVVFIEAEFVRTGPDRRGVA
jgi:hypothetical protein